jgi:hypothetical protein
VVVSAHTTASVADANVIIPMEIDPETKNPLGMMSYESVSLCRVCVVGVLVKVHVILRVRGSHRRSSSHPRAGSDTVSQADFGRKAFLSTLAFVSHLTQIADQLTTVWFRFLVCDS